MNAIEKNTLAELEATIERGLQTFYEVGSALLKIRNEKLYRETHGTFEAYCRERWAMASSWARQIMDATRVMASLQKSDAIPSLLPRNAEQAKPLAVLRDEDGNMDTKKQQEAWQRAVETAPNGKITGAHVQSVVDEMRGIERKPEPIAHAESWSPPEREPLPIPKPMHTNNVPVSQQWHNKLIYNLANGHIDLSEYETFTIGYSQRSWEQVAELLRVARVEVLADIRANAHSQYKPEFSKGALVKACKEIGVHYVHLPELGIASELRADLPDTHDYDSLWEAYRQQLKGEAALEAFEHLGHLYDQYGWIRVCYMCMELDPTTCHRHILADYEWRKADFRRGLGIFDL